MIYLHRYTPGGVDIAACEDASHTERYESRGFTRCTPDAFREAWRLRDELALADLWPDAPAPPEQAREVGGVPPLRFVRTSL